MEQYTGNALGHLSINPGDVIEVVGSTDCGLLEGYIRGVNRSGFFPAQCVQEVNIRQKNIVNVSTASPAYRPNEDNNIESIDENIIHQYNSATAPRIKKTLVF